MSQVFASPCYAIKIGLQTTVDSASIGTSVKGIIIDANTNHSICDLEAMKGYEIKPYHNLMAIQYKGKFYKVNSDNIVIKPTSAGFVSAKGHWYRGIIMIQNKNGKLTVKANYLKTLANGVHEIVAENAAGAQSTLTLNVGYVPVGEIYNNDFSAMVELNGDQDANDNFFRNSWFLR